MSCIYRLSVQDLEFRVFEYYKEVHSLEPMFEKPIETPIAD